MAKVPAEATSLLGLLLCLPTAFLGIADGKLRVGLIIFVGIALVFLTLVTITRLHYASWRKKYDATLAAAQQSQLETFLKRLAVPLSQELASVAATGGKDRKIDVATLKRGIVEAAASAVGQRVDAGTRVHLFEFKTDDQNGPRLIASRFVAGSGHASLRTFGPSDITYQKTLEGERRFVPDTSDATQQVSDVHQYKTFMTYPVEGAANEFYGVLTVDCKEAGDLDGNEDGRIMQYLAALLAATYAFEGVGATRGTREIVTTH